MTDYVFVMVAANRGGTSITLEHFKCAVCMNLPIIILMTKIDLTPEHITKNTLQACKDMTKKHQRKLYKLTNNNKFLKYYYRLNGVLSSILEKKSYMRLNNIKLHIQ